MTDRDQRPGVTERIANQVIKLPRVLANPLLNFLGRERPSIETYSQEIDLKIQALLQEKTRWLEYANVTIQSLGKSEGNSTGFPYTYQILAGEISPGWGRKYTQNVQSELRRVTQNEGLELDYSPEIALVLVRLKPANHMSVKKTTKWGYNEN